MSESNFIRDFFNEKKSSIIVGEYRKLGIPESVRKIAERPAFSGTELEAGKIGKEKAQ